jgi:hypothetical protein
VNTVTVELKNNWFTIKIFLFTLNYRVKEKNNSLDFEDRLSIRYRREHSIHRASVVLTPTQKVGEREREGNRSLRE